ncbi:MAG: TyeA family type III secretion system gatekeeper subunit [Puniceicoccales bacterium]|jgi:hypothetical protein|nr:TyeA family type III secretion system gatekeeper subunit [Puniceicoccales bacterium]
MSEEDRAPAIFAITRLMELIRRLPMKFFEDPDSRSQILDMMQEELDELIILEEREQEEALNGTEEEEEEEGEEEIDASNIVTNA